MFLVLCLLQVAPLRAMDIDPNVQLGEIQRFNNEALDGLSLAMTPETLALSPGMSLSGPVHVPVFHSSLLEAFPLPLTSGLRRVRARAIGASRTESSEPPRAVETLRWAAIPGQAGPVIDGGRPHLAVVRSMPTSNSNVVALRGDYASWVAVNEARKPRVDAKFFASAVHLDFSQLRTEAFAEGRREWEGSDPLLRVIGVDDYGRIYLKDMEQGIIRVIPPDRPLHPLPLLDAVGPDGKGYRYDREQDGMQILDNDGRLLQAVPLGMELAFSAIEAMFVDWFGGMSIEPIFAFSQEAVLRGRRRLLTFTGNGVLRAALSLKDGSSWATNSRGDVFIFEEEPRGVFTASEYPAGERESSRRIVLAPHPHLGPKEHLRFSIDRQGRFVMMSSNGTFWLFSSDGKSLTRGELPKGSFNTPPMFDGRGGIFFYDDAAGMYRLQQRREAGW